jgi:chromosome segregation ATPase
VAGTGWTRNQCRARVRELEHEVKRLASRSEQRADRIIALEAEVAATQQQLAQAQRERNDANKTARRLLAELEQTQRNARRSAPESGEPDTGATAD